MITMSTEIKEGSRVRARYDIVHAADDYQPRAILAYKGEELEVRKLREGAFLPYIVAHQGVEAGQSFGAKAEEIELVDA